MCKAKLDIKQKWQTAKRSDRHKIFPEQLDWIKINQSYWWQGITNDAARWQCTITQKRLLEWTNLKDENNRLQNIVHYTLLTYWPKKYSPFQIEKDGCPSRRNRPKTLITEAANNNDDVVKQGIVVIWCKVIMWSPKGRTVQFSLPYKLKEEEICREPMKTM